jgi:transposase
MVATGVVAGAGARFERAARRRRPTRLVAGDRRRVAGGRQKRGDAVARSFRGSAGSRYHLIVAADGLPLAIELTAGNENERRQLLPLLDTLLARGIQPRELWADRGYDSAALEQALRERAIEPHISKRRRASEPIDPDQIGRQVWRGKKRVTKSRDPQAAQRWPVERTNAWMKSMRRIATRHDRKADNYLAFLQLSMIVILARSF